MTIAAYVTADAASFGGIIKWLRMAEGWLFVMPPIRGFGDDLRDFDSASVPPGDASQTLLGIEHVVPRRRS